MTTIDRKLKLPRIQVGNKQYTRYNPGIALHVVERIANGELLKNICSPKADPLVISKTTFLHWVSTVPELAKAYAIAQQLSAQSFEEEAIDVAQKVSDAPGNAQNVAAKSLLISQYRWSATRRDPKKYSDKGNTQIIVPVNINTTLDLGQTSGVENDNEVYSISLSGSEPEDAVYEELEAPEQTPTPLPTPTPDPTPTPTLSPKASAISTIQSLLHTDKPVIGKSHQPSLQPLDPDWRKRPRKRVLTPRIKVEKK